ncbi:MAG: 50S ribosomal protein L4 [Planctomycetota bacterium]
MLEVPVYNTSGEQVDTMQVDEAVFGGEVNASVLKQAVVAYHLNKRQGSAANRSRGMVAGSGKKLFRQKGTGNARRGALRTHKVRGGGVAFAKRPYAARKKLPKGMRKAALNSAILAKLQGEDFKIVDGLSMDAPKTKEMAAVLQNLEINRRCLLALADRDSNVYLSSRNIPDLTVRITEELNAFDVVMRPKMLVTVEAMKALIGQEDQA